MSPKTATVKVEPLSRDEAMLGIVLGLTVGNVPDVRNMTKEKSTEAVREWIANFTELLAGVGMQVVAL